MASQIGSKGPAECSHNHAVPGEGEGPIARGESGWWGDCLRDLARPISRGESATLLLLPQFLPGLIGVTALQAVCFTYPLADTLSIATAAAFIIPELVKLHRRNGKGALPKAA